MNFSPLNDPDFAKFREEEHIKAAKKRRKKVLISLVAITLILAIGFGLLAMAAYAAFPGLLDKITTTDAPSPDTPSPKETIETFLPPVESDDPSTVSPETKTDAPSTETPTRELHVTTVYVDAGHGFLNASGDAIDIGAGNNSYYMQYAEEKLGKKLYEADLNAQIALKVKEKLIEKGYWVIMSREDYVYEKLPINARAARAAETSADLLVSIHANSAEEGAYGPRVLFNDKPDYTFSLESKRLAQLIGSKIDRTESWTKNASIVADSSLAMLKVPFPSVLVETCFITNRNDALLALDENWQNNMAQAIVDAVVSLYPVQTTFI